MIIKGEYRDVLQQGNQSVQDRGWQSNRIVSDYGNFLAALMKKSFTEMVGIEYMAVGSGSNDEDHFKTKVGLFFDTHSQTLDQPLINTNEGWWVWAKEIDAATTIDYLIYDNNSQDYVTTDDITNTIRLEVEFPENIPSDNDTLEFGEFALLGIPKNPLDPNKMFFVNYVEHGPITKDVSMSLTRTVRLTFPIETS